MTRYRNLKTGRIVVAGEPQGVDEVVYYWIERDGKAWGRVFGMNARKFRMKFAEVK